MPFIDVVVNVFWRVGEVNVGEHLRNFLSGVGDTLYRALSFQSRVYLCGLTLIVNVVP